MAIECHDSGWDVAREDACQPGFFAISKLGVPELGVPQLPEPPDCTHHSSVHSTMPAYLLSTAIDESQCPRFRYLEQRLCAEVSKLLAEHHDRMVSCIEKLSTQIFENRGSSPKFNYAARHQEEETRVACAADMGNKAEMFESIQGNTVQTSQQKRGIGRSMPESNTEPTLEESPGLRGKTRSNWGSEKTGNTGRSKTRSNWDSEASHLKTAKAVGGNTVVQPHTVERTYCQKIVFGMPFQCAFAMAIFSNALVIGWEIDRASQDPGGRLPEYFTIISHVYAFFFTTELLLKMVAEGKAFFGREEILWNLTDVILVLAAILESFGEIVSSDRDSSFEVAGSISSMRIVRFVRILRVIRVVRVSRLVRIFASLRTLVYSIASTLRDLFWTVFLLTMLIYMSAVFFTQAFIDSYTYDHSGSIEFWWGSLLRSMLTLYKIISGGVSWHDPAEALELVGAGWVMLLVVYVFFTYFAVLNVITGIFCNSAIETAARNPDLIASSLIANKKQLEQRIRKLFSLLDIDGTGEITLAELELIFKDSETQAYFEAIGLDSHDAWALFRLVDTDKTHTIEVDEFISGVMRLKGEARAIDVATLLYDQERLLRKISKLLQISNPNMKSESSGVRQDAV